MLLARIKRSGWLAAGFWTAVVAYSLYANIRHEYANVEEQAAKVARANLNKDQAFRQWVSARGGLYGQVSPLLQTNPYLSHIPSQNIQTSVGELTLLNPAYILRMLMDEYATLYGIKGRIVGLKALNPGNLADPWERRAIEVLGRDPKLGEYAEISEMEGKPFLRMMIPMYMKPDCMKCHAILGYRVGDLRGGVNISVPLEEFYLLARDASLQLAATHGGIWLLGLAGIGFMTRRTLRDTRERERDYQELRLAARVFDESLQAIMITDAEGNIERVNRRFREMTGFDAGEAIGASPRILKSARHGPEFYDAFWRTLEETGIWQGELVNRRKNGEEFHAWESIVSLRDEHGRVRHYISLMEDISDRKRAEETLKHLNEDLERRVGERTAALAAAKNEAERANLAKSEFLSQMSHELRTPLNAILGFGQILKLDPSEPLSGRQSGQIDEILQAGGHLLGLINDVLDLAKVEAGKLPIAIEPYPLQPLLGDSLALIRPGCEARGLRLQLDNPLPDPVMLLCDPVRLRQILLNLLSNAVKYNKPGAEVRLGVERLPGAMLRLSVTDHGEGLDANDLARLFTPFERLRQHSHIEGTGIGLALSKQLIVRMGGDIGVSSRVGVGTTFWIDVPLAETAATAPVETTSEPAAPPAAAAAAAETEKRRYDILYIEDNPANMKVVAKFLELRGIELIEATRPSEGLALAEARRPDLILLDIQMPEMNGYEVLARLKEKEATRAIPVIAISANAMPRDFEKARAAGFDAYLAKPLDLQAFLQELDRHLPPA